MSRRALSIGFGAIVVGAGVVFATVNKVSPVSWELWGPINEEGGLALKGYDPVAYHTEGVAKLGSEQISLEWSQVERHFYTEENRRLFEADSESYAPATAASAPLLSPTD